MNGTDNFFFHKLVYRYVDISAFDGSYHLIISYFVLFLSFLFCSYWLRRMINGKSSMDINWVWSYRFSHLQNRSQLPINGNTLFTEETSILLKNANQILRTVPRVLKDFGQRKLFENVRSKHMQEEVVDYDKGTRKKAEKSSIWTDEIVHFYYFE